MSSTSRERIYNEACGDNQYPTCNICGLAIAAGQMWDTSHDPTKPKWLNGAITGIAHRRCNRIWNHQHDTPLWAKSERIRKRHLDIPRSRTPLPGGRDDQLKKTLRGEVVDRRTGERWGGWRK